MEETKNADAPKMETPAATSTPEATSTEGAMKSPAMKGPNNMPMLIGVGVVVVAVIAAIIAGVVLIINNNGGLGGSGSTEITALNPGNPDQALTLINDKIGDVVLAASSGDTDQITAALSEFGDVQGGEFTLNLKGKDATMELDVVMTGKFKGAEKPEDVAFEANIQITGVIPDFGPILTPITIDMVIVNDTMYLNMDNLPAEVSDLLGYLGLSEGNWYSLPLDAETTQAAEALTGTSITEKELADLEKEIEENPLFLNARSTDDRVISGITAKCMFVDPNPGAGVDVASDATPLEICSPEGDFLPLFFGMTATEDGTDIEFSFTINSLDNDLTITAPAGAEDLEALLNALGGGF